MKVIFFFNDTANTEIYTLSLHDALPISNPGISANNLNVTSAGRVGIGVSSPSAIVEIKDRSEEHTSELQSLTILVCRLLLEKKHLSSAFSYPKLSSPGSCSIDIHTLPFLSTASNTQHGL